MKTDATARFDPPPRSLETTAFIARFGGIYEHAPWVAEAVAAYGLSVGHDTVAGLAQAMRAVVDSASHDTQLELLRAHPDLAGRAAVRGELTADSTTEQASAGLDQCTPEQFERLTDLNTQYRQRFGFPFILAVRNRTRQDIIDNFASRLDNDVDTEFATALSQVHEIARLRLLAMAEQHTHNTNPFAHWVDLAQPRIGSHVVEVSDEFFGAVERLLQPGEPVFIPDRYDDHGKWMDGWESRRRRGPGHDYCVIRLGQSGIVQGVDIDTRHFTGNYPPEAMLEGCICSDEIPGTDAGWHPLLERVALGPDSHHYFDARKAGAVTHLRLHIYPDGGVARLRVYGEVAPDWQNIDTSGPIDLLALEHGGRALACSDEHYGTMHNLNAPGRGVNMGDGWETARRRGPGHDWVVLALGAAGVIERIEVDTAHFKGNYPDRVSIEALYLDNRETGPDAVVNATGWRPLLPESRLEADRQHYFDDTVLVTQPATHVRMNIFPDGGVSRLRLFGRLESNDQS